LNMFLQLAILYFAYSYIVGNSVWTLQGYYAKFHSELFDADGTFQHDTWQSWKGPRAEICDAVVTKPPFLGCILFLWIGRMLGEFKSTQRQIREIRALPAAHEDANLSHCILERGTEGADCEIIALTCPTRLAILLLVMTPKIVVCVLLGVMGCVWLTATTSFADLILNALALEFIIGIDENILDFFLPARTKARLGSTKLAYAKQEVTPEKLEQDIVADSLRNIGYLVLCVLMTIVFVMYQQVLPFFSFDIHEHCGDWYMNQFNPKCPAFPKGCFPFKGTDAPYHYGELQP